MMHPAPSPIAHPLTRADRLKNSAVAGAQPFLEGNLGRAASVEAPVAALPRCIWCQRSFRPRTTGGSKQRFCCPSCREEFFGAARAWALLALERGLVSP